MVESGTSESSERADVSRNSMVPWERFWCRRGDQPILHDDFLVERERSEWGASKQDVRLATLSELSRVPGLVLLGDPGTGKSFELKAEERRASNVAEGAERVVRLDLKSYTERTVERFVLDSPSVRGWSRGEHSLTLILDSLDECWRRVESLGPLLAEGLIAARPHGEAAPRLRLRLGCRGAEWRREIENALAKLFPEKTDDEASLQVWVIAPLTRRQALDYATVQLTVGSAFMVAVDQREVTALAAHPITLSMLVEGFKADGKLGGTRADVYESGLLRLCRDEHTSPGGARSSMHARQRLTVASRIAAVGVLSNRYLINGNFDAPPDGASFAMAAVGLVGYFSEPSAGDSVSCTQETLAETLRCGLFEGQAGQYRSWRHQSYAEFLAARYFNERRPPLDDVLALLCDRSRGHPRLHVQLEETACWLAGLWPELFTALVRDNADVFFHCDPARLSAERRSELVRHFFDQLDRDEAETPHWGDQARLARLEHPGLAEQLGPILENVSGNWMLRDAALDIARACHVHALGSVALDRLLDSHEVPTIRSGAGMLLREVGDENLRAELKRRLTSETFTGSDEVRGHCLYLLWPEFLSVAELVEFLVPETRDHTYGIYQDFRARRLPETIQAEHLPALLVWARRRVKAEAERDQRDELPEKIALVALRHLNESAVRREFVMLLKECAEHCRALLGHNKVVLASDAALRHDLWHTIVTARISVIDSLGSASLRDSGLWNHDDLPWLVAQAEAAATSGDRQEWCHAVFQLFDFSQAPHVECVWPCVERYPEFASYWLTRTASRLPDDEEKNWEKRNYYRTQREQKLEADRKARAKPLVVHVDEMLAAFASGKTGAMWWLNIRLSGLVVAEREDGGGFPRRGLMEGAAWQALPTEAQERVLDAACTFLMEVPVEPEKVLHRATIFVLYSASARFLCLIFLRRPQWIDERDREFWKKWALVLVAYQSRSGESKDATWGRVARLALTTCRLILRWTKSSSKPPRIERRRLGRRSTCSVGSLRENIRLPKSDLSQSRQRSAPNIVIVGRLSLQACCSHYERGLTGQKHWASSNEIPNGARECWLLRSRAMDAKKHGRTNFRQRCAFNFGNGSTSTIRATPIETDPMGPWDWSIIYIISGMDC